jgi:hypothetical protein
MNKPTTTFRLALSRIAAVMEKGACTHPSGDWRDESASFHTGRAERHLRLLRETDTTEDHLAHAACRLLMALELRESAAKGCEPISPASQYIAEAVQEYMRNRPQ